MTAKDKEFRQKIQILEPLVRIGKLGLSETVVEEIKKLLKKKKLIKIKILPSAFGEKTKAEFISELVAKTESELVHKVGFVVVLKYLRPTILRKIKREAEKSN